jgi:integrase
MGLQEWGRSWAAPLARHRRRALRLTSAVLRSAVRNRLIPFNPADEVRIPRARQQTPASGSSRSDLRTRLLPAVPERHRVIVATAGGAGLRWGEAAGLLRMRSTWTRAGCP